jgi:hypothetical protein
LSYYDVVNSKKIPELQELLLLKNDKPSAVKPENFKKQGKSKLRERIINFDEVVEYCKIYYKDSLILTE